MEELIQEFENLKIRFNNGCDYLEKHPNEIDLWEDELLKIFNRIDMLSYVLGRK